MNSSGMPKCAKKIDPSQRALGAKNIREIMTKGYVKSIYAKLQVTNRSEVTLEAIRLGIIESV
ncbi:MAG: hypothetical protein Q7V56_13760 [Gammaproteobacteria bacterium]|nr:hypothetical protein [Gammaproteobacteria bacterium]